MGEVKLFVSGIPTAYSEADVEELFVPYGDVIEVHMLPLKGNNNSRSAFVRYGTSEEGTRAIEGLNGVEFTGQSDRLVVKHSTATSRGSSNAGGRGSDKTPRSDRAKLDMPGRARAPLPDRQPRRAGGAATTGSGGGGSGSNSGSGPADKKGPLLPEKRMLFFTIKNDPQGKINCKVLDKVLMQCGQPVKVLVIPNSHGDGCQGWALMDEAKQSERAIQTLSGRNIFRDDCLLHLELSDKADIDVKYNNDFSWDYLAQLPSSAPILEDEPPVTTRSGGRGPRDAAPVIRAGADSADRRDRERDRGDRERERERERDRGDRDRERDRDVRDRDHNNGANRSGGSRSSGVVLVNGITTEVDAQGNRVLGCEGLEKIMGVFGDVMRIKLLPPKSEDAKHRQALVQFRRAEEAENAKEKLNNCPLFGARLGIHMSNKDDIRIPEDADDTFVDYSESQSGRFGPHFPIHRLQQARPPSNVLYLSGLEPSISDEDILDFFNSDGAVKAERFRTKKGEAKVEFNSIEDATAALVKHHGTTRMGSVELPRSLRIAFSDRTITDAPLQVISHKGGDRHDRR